MTHPSTRLPVLIACGTFLALGAALIPYGGVENDEALFAAPLYEQNAKEFCVRVFHHYVPVMAMSYIGTLKTLIYIPILHFFGPNAWSVRLPMVLVGALTVFFLYRLLLLTTGSAAALLAAFLLASDPIFVLTDTYDWGPVALEHLLLVTGCYFLVRFARGNSRMRDLAAGFFFLGLGLWNKAIFLWALAGLACATALVFHRELRQLARPRSVAVAAGAFLAGALPFVIYNVRQPNATLGSNAHFDSRAGAIKKIPMMYATLDGSGLFGFLPRADWATNPKQPASVRGRAAQWIREYFGEHNRNWLPYGFALSLLCLPWWRRSRLAWFALIFMAVSWTAMLFSRDAGTAVHHAVLLWPFPEMFMAVALGSLPWRRLAAVIGAVLVAGNLLVVSEYIYEFERNGANGFFTDSLFALSRAIPDPPQLNYDRIYVVDWGMLNTLALFHQGRLPLVVADPPFMSALPSPADRNLIDFMMGDRRGLFVGHTPGNEVNAGVRETIEKEAARRGLHKEILETIYDSSGRPFFEIFRLNGQT